MRDAQLEQQLQDILESQVENGDECGCQLAVFRDGVLVADLVAGWTDPSKTRNVTSDLLFPIFSCGKGVLSTAFHMLCDRGLIHYDQRVAELWPEFGGHGKEDIRVRHILSHQAGLAALPQGTTYAERADWERMCRHMENAQPAYEPGTKTTYHAITFAWLVGETARRALGGDLEGFIRNELFQPLGIEQELYFGLPESAESRTVPLDGSCFGKKNDHHLEINTCIPVRRGFIPSFNGMGTARALARHYAALAETSSPGFHPLTQATIETATTVNRSPDDPVPSGAWTTFGLGYVVCGSPEDPVVMFGHGGAGGSEGFACRGTGLAVGFTKNRLSAKAGVHPTRDRISEALGLPVRHW